MYFIVSRNILKMIMATMHSVARSGRHFWFRANAGSWDRGLEIVGMECGQRLFTLFTVPFRVATDDKVMVWTNKKQVSEVLQAIEETRDSVFYYKICVEEGGKCFRIYTDPSRILVAELPVVRGVDYK